MTTDTAKDTTKAPATEKTDKQAPAKITKTSSKPAAKAASKADEPKAVEEKTDVKESAKTPKLPTIKIENSGPYNVLETATGVLLKAKQTTTVSIPAHVDKDQIIRNIKQMNITRGKTLKILD